MGVADRVPATRVEVVVVVVVVVIVVVVVLVVEVVDACATLARQKRMNKARSKTCFALIPVFIFSTLVVYVSFLCFE